MPVKTQSAIATKKIVRLLEISLDSRVRGQRYTYRAATDESTGDVSEIKIRKDPENAATILVYDKQKMIIILTCVHGH